ncbi:MAG: F0F1 ATP synthase subunit B [Elusimicrobia bacterium]|nr:F0F1 ATP synthase subunit B [Elusimicrobiota bacterium]MDE2426728.1 F0F1 ATP synthase subunit B [Elusimicrobiota bacterium]
MNRLLDPDTGMIIWTIVTFLALVLVLKLSAWGPLLRAIAERDSRIKANVDAAEAARAAAEQVRADLDVQMAGLSAKGRELLAQAQKEAEALRIRLRASAEADSASLRQKTMQDLAAEKDRLVGELRKEVAGLSVLAAEKLIRKSIDAGVQKSVLEDFYRDLDARKAAN